MGKREECLAALFGNVVFSFLLCQASEQPRLPFHYNQVFLLTVSLYTDHLLFHVLSHTQCLTVRRGVFLLLQ